MENQTLNNNLMDCPVCGYKNIPNYKEEDVICTCCDTDLSIYRLINQQVAISSKETIVTNEVIVTKTPKKLKWVIGASFVLVLLFAGLYLLNPKTIVDKQKENELNAQINTLKSENAELKKQPPNTVSIVKDFEYTVRRGDSFSLISWRIYGTESRAEEIAKKNNVTLDTILHPGDKLIIPL